MALVKALYPYQREPVSLFLRDKSRLVAYAPGLGKTIIAIAAAERLLDAGEIGLCLIVVPANLKWQWAQRLAEYTDMFTTTIKVKNNELTVPNPEEVVVIEGTPAKRKMQWDYCENKWKPSYLIMSYESVVSDWQYIKRLGPQMVILDEASAIKGFKAKRTKKIKKVLNVDWRMALTATPVENRPEEIYSIMQWVNPEILGRYDLFDRAYIVRNNFGGIKRYKNLNVLHTRLSACMSRKDRTDPDVRPYLPEVDEGEWTVDLDPATQKVYDIIAAELLAELENISYTGTFDLHAYYQGKGDGGHPAMGNVMAMTMALEMLLDHPDLVVASGATYRESQWLQSQGLIKASWPGSKYAFQLLESGVLDDLHTSAKFEFIKQRLPEILAFSKDSKAVLFTRYRFMLDILQGELDIRSVQYHGDMSAKDKAATVARFAEDPSIRLMLSSHSGAYGTDLPMCDYLINYDLPWSAGVAEQINGRHVRASSEFKQVYIRNVITGGTIEERKLDVLRWKARTASAILTGQGAGYRGQIDNDVASLTKWLRA